MKKFKGVLSFAVVLLATIMCTACFGPSYTKMTVVHSDSPEFLIGEDYSDPYLKVTAYLDDDTSEDVTSQATIDTSKYNKNEAGKYDIFVKFDEFSYDYKVEVVDEITKTSSVSSRFSKLVETTYGDSYSFSATYREELWNDICPLTQVIKGKVNADGTMAFYISWTLFFDEADHLWAEFWYEGTKTQGIATIGMNAYGGGDLEYEVEDMNLLEFSDELCFLDDGMEMILTPDVIVDFNDADMAISGSITKSGDIYTLVSGYITLTYQNNIIKTINGIAIDWNDVTIPVNNHITAA